MRRSTFQTFEDIGGPVPVAGRVAEVRNWLAAQECAGVIVGHGDEYLSEYMPACAERLLWLTGFSGSAGTAVVLRDAAVLFVDGRYTLQAAAQTDGTVFQVVLSPPASVEAWLRDHLNDAPLAYDPRLHSMASVQRLSGLMLRAGPLPVDSLWADRPPAPGGSAEDFPAARAGRSRREKLDLIRARLLADGHAATVLATLDSVAWAFNLRGSDTPHTPFVEARAIVPATGQPTLFIAAEKLPLDLREVLAGDAAVRSPAAFSETLAALAGPVRLDPGLTPDAIAGTLREAGVAIVEARDPCLDLRARKTAAEIDGARAAQRIDGVAMARLLHWLDAHAFGLDEIGVAIALEEFRAASGQLREISFDTIAGSGPNGAIVHYRPTEATNRRLEPGTLLLIDSGGQYLCGTTDITRTVAIGAPTAAMRRHFTLVLRGHIAIARARFPAGTRGVDLDPLARQALWQAGLDYDHGTGHGVGSFASVHEGPGGISRRSVTALEPGMILSNEPGLYLEGAYGIRIENLVLVCEPMEIPGGKPMHGFETLTLAPIDRHLIEMEMVQPDELRWLDSYHARVFEALAPHLADDAGAWLEAATRPLVARELST